jgi:hypothetical protein
MRYVPWSFYSQGYCDNAPNGISYGTFQKEVLYTFIVITKAAL